MSKIKLFLAALILTFITSSLNAQDYYYNLSGEKIECEVKSWDLNGIKINNGKTKLKAEEINAVIVGEDSILRIHDHGISSMPKNVLVKVVVAGPIEFYTVDIQKMDGGYQNYCFLRKGNVYLRTDGSKKEWQELFNDNTEVYNKVKELKAKDYYYNTAPLIELITQYNEEAGQ